jgi:outer membrane beta-barrel protein
MRACLVAAAVVLILALVPSALAAPAPKGRPPRPENVEAESIRDNYWSKGEERDLGVVQNRLYSKDGKLELGAFGGWISTDPFLSVRALGLSLGYHFSEYLALRALALKEFVSGSAALTTLQTTSGATANTNEPRSFVGGELEASVLYGKLSLLGQSILYYDFHFLGGAGVTATESGNYVTPSLGLGQQFYLTQGVALRVDYRAMPFKEKILEKSPLRPAFGQPVEERTNWTHAVTLGVVLMIGG